MSYTNAKGRFVTTGGISETLSQRGQKLRQQAPDLENAPRPHLVAELRRLREALEAYADPRNWKESGRPGAFCWYGGGESGFTFAREAMRRGQR